MAEPPFCFRTAGGSVSGCDVEVARRLLQQTGHALVAVETEFDQLVPGLIDGRWDMTTGLFVTPERSARIAFSRPIWALPDGLLVRAAEADRFTGYRSLAHQPQARLGVVRDQIQHGTARDAGVPDDRIVVLGTYAEAAAALTAGKIDAYASVAMAHRGHINRTGDRRLAVVDVAIAEKPAESGAFGFAKANAALRAAIDSGLDEFLGAAEHRALMTRFGFSAAAVDLVAPRRA